MEANVEKDKNICADSTLQAGFPTSRNDHDSMQPAFFGLILQVFVCCVYNTCIWNSGLHISTVGFALIMMMLAPRTWTE